MSSVLAVDLGGTSMRAARVDEDGTVHDRCERATPRTDDHTPFLRLLHDVLATGPVDAAVVGVPGRIDYGAGELEHAPNLASAWRDDLSQAALERALGLPVSLANDADLAAVGESWFGAGRPHRDVVYLTVSTGIGAGVVTGGLLVHGRRSLAEVGHTLIDWRALGPGRRRTLEELGSGTALGQLGLEAGIEGGGPAVEEAWRRGDAEAARVWRDVTTAAAVGAVNLAHLFTPDVIVVGGGLGLVGDAVLDPMRSLLAELGPRDLPEPVVVVNAALGDDAGLAGAAAWSRAFVPPTAGSVDRGRPTGGARG